MADITTNTLKIGDNNLVLRDADAQAKVAVNTQDISGLKDGLSALNVPVLTAKWVDGCLKSDGSIQAAAAYKTSQLIHIPAGFTLVFGSYASTSTYHFCNYEANGTFKSIGIGNTGLLGRQNIRIDAIEDRYVKICTNTSQINLSASNPHFERIKSEPTGLTDISNVGPASGVTFVSGYLSSSTHSRTDSDVYHCSSVIFLQKGQTIEYRCSGSSGATLLMQTARGGGYIANLVVGNYDYHRLAYTNNTGDDIWVRICSRTAAGGNYVPLDLFKEVKMYYKTLYHADEKLDGKKIVVIGDSLIYGNLLGNGVTWTAIMQNDTGAEVYNYGINGNAISSVSGGTGTPMSVRYADIEELPTADIVVVEGGANDYNNACPLGTLADTQNNTFIGAVNVLIDGIRQLAPQAQILFMTTYNRTAAANSAGLHYADYANAMVNACANRSVPCYNNFANSGLALDNTNLTAWCDEGLYLGHSSVNRHFSPKAYDWLYPLYKHFIESRFS